MPPGADKIIAFDPPGAIGLPPDGAVILLRFDEGLATTPPKDAAGSVADMGITGTLTRPAVVAGAIGRARSFAPASLTGLVAKDLVPGSTLLTRDLTIQVILQLNTAAQHATGDVGIVIARGLGTTSAEGVSFALELFVQDAPSSTWTMRISGVDDPDPVQFTAPAGFTMLTATRRWISPTSILYRYYIGDVFLGEVLDGNGDVGGGTTGTMQVGTQFSAGAFGMFFAGAIDELLVLDHEITHEEIEATWLRIVRYQPRGVKLFTELHDPGFPMPTDPASDAQLETRMIGMALGYAAAAAENMRANTLPIRAYGPVLDDWETVVQPSKQPLHDVDTRRSRILAKIPQRQGSSPTGLATALEPLLGGAPPSALQFLAYDNTITEPFATIDPLRWDVTPAASWTAAGGGARSSPAAGNYQFTGALQNWLYVQTPVGGDGKQAHLLSKVVMTTAVTALEAGIFFGQRAANNFLLLGLRDTAGVFAIVTESFIANVSQGVVVQATLGGNPAALWLHLFQTTVDGTWTAAWSTTSGTAGFTLSTGITHPTVAQWGGLYVRSIGGATAGAGQIDADDLVLRAPFGHRPLNAYVLLDSALGFSPDVDAAHDIIQTIKHAFVNGTFITRPKFLLDDPQSGLDRGPLGGG